MRGFVIILLLLWGLAACSSKPEVPLGAVASTPVYDLPISVTVPETIREIPTNVPENIIQEADAEYLLLSNIYARSAPSVVNIEAVPAGVNVTTIHRGSGFIFDQAGHILTNAHVIRNAASILVTFNDGYVANAQLVGTDTFSDLAVIRVSLDAARLQPLTLMADSNAVQVGQRAIAIGNPFGLSSSMSVGVVSGLGRMLRSAELIDEAAPEGFQNPAIIQTDTPINPGNSGGPLLNSQGEVMGVTTAIRTESGVFQGVGFAIPANTVRRIVPELIERGRIDYAWMGISIHPEGNSFSVAGLAEILSLPVSRGVLLRGVAVGGPADEANLRGGSQLVQVRGESVCIGGDIIVAINNTYIRNMDDLTTYMLVNTRPNERVTLLIVRNHETFEVPVVLRSRPDSAGTVRDCTG